MKEYFECECGRKVASDEFDFENPVCPACGKELSFEDHETDVDAEAAQAAEKEAAREIIEARRRDVGFRRFILLVIALVLVGAAVRILSEYHLVWIGKAVPYAIRKEKAGLAETFYRLSTIRGEIAEDPANRKRYPVSVLQGLQRAGLLGTATRPAGEKGADRVDREGE
ncbi:MAG: hypothetical protein V2A58_11080 [Planctomycetota bacterium]